jgi:hypothetical protein
MRRSKYHIKTKQQIISKNYTLTQLLLYPLLYCYTIFAIDVLLIAVACSFTALIEQLVLEMDESLVDVVCR